MLPLMSLSLQPGSLLQCVSFLSVKNMRSSHLPLLSGGLRVSESPGEGPSMGQQQASPRESSRVRSNCGEASFRTRISASSTPHERTRPSLRSATAVSHCAFLTCRQ